MVKIENVSPEEIEKFNELSQFWWDPEGPLKPLHQVQPVRLQFIRKQVDLYHKNILDVGCGGGILTESLAGFSQSVTGIDMAKEVLAVAKAHAQDLKNPPTYICETAEQFAKTHPGTYDIITCLELIEHVPEPKSLMQALSQLLKPGGHLFISTLNRTLKSFMMAIVGAEYVMRFLPKGTHHYETFIKPSELAQLARQYGFHCAALKGLTYRILSRDFTLTTDCSVNYIAHFQKENS